MMACARAGVDVIDLDEEEVENVAPTAAASAQSSRAAGTTADDPFEIVSSDEDEAMSCEPSKAAAILNLGALRREREARRGAPTAVAPAAGNAAAPAADMLTASERQLSCDASKFLQLRDDSDPERTWAISLREMLEPVGTVTHVLLSTFGHCDAHFQEFRRQLKMHCPRLKELCIVSDWKNTGGVGGSKDGQHATPMLPEGTTSNPFFFSPDLPEDGIRYAFVFPRLGDDLSLPKAMKGRGTHSIQHTKLLLVRHAAGGDAAAHLRVHVMSCNIDNLSSMKGGCGDTVWRSPHLVALPPDPHRVMPVSDAARRFGHPLFKMVSSFLDGALDKQPRLREWSDMLAGYE